MNNKQFAILGLGHFGEALALELSSLGADVIAVDSNEDKVQNIADSVTYAVQADVADINALKSIGLTNVDVAVVNITSDVNANLTGVINCQELGIPEVYSKSNSFQHTKVLHHLNVAGVFDPERDSGEQTAVRLFSGGFLHQLELDNEYSIVEISSLKQWANKSLERLNLRNKYGINVIALIHNEELNISPEPSEKIYKGDRMIVVGKNEVIRDLQREFLEQR